MPKYEVLTYTLCDGWVNCWSITEADGTSRPHIFNTHQEAQDAIDEFLQEIAEDIEDGLREPDQGYDESEFMVREIPDEEIQDQEHCSASRGVGS